MEAYQRAELETGVRFLEQAGILLFKLATMTDGQYGCQIFINTYNYEDYDDNNDNNNNNNNNNNNVFE